MEVGNLGCDALVGPECFGKISLGADGGTVRLITAGLDAWGR